MAPLPRPLKIGELFIFFCFFSFTYVTYVMITDHEWGMIIFIQTEFQARWVFHFIQVQVPALAIEKPASPLDANPLAT